MTAEEHPSRQRRATPGFRQLPAQVERKSGPLPQWPLGDPTPEEKAKWKKMWYLPQSIVWRELSLYDDVALYVRLWCRATGPKAPSYVFNEVRAIDAKLGISPRAMRNLHWEIAAAPPKEPKGPKAAKVLDLADRVKAVE